MRTISKVIDILELPDIIKALRSENRKIVFTNGCFDLLHVGHIRYLEGARERGGALIVGVNSDGSVRELKGSNRPIVSDIERAEMVAALDVVDYVVIFYDTIVKNLIQIIKPDVYIKGGDYKAVENLNKEEVAVLREVGSEIELMPLDSHYSTTGLIDKIKKCA